MFIFFLFVFACVCLFLCLSVFVLVFMYMHVIICYYLPKNPIQKSCLSETTFTKRFNKLVELLLAAKHITPSSVDWAKKVQFFYTK